MKNFVNLLLLVSLFNAFSIQAMEDKSGESRKLLLNDNVQTRTALEKGLLEYRQIVVDSLSSMGSRPSGEYKILFIIADEFDRDEYGHSLQKFIEAIARKTTTLKDNPRTNKTIKRIGKMRSSIISKNHKKSPVQIILEKTADADSNAAVAAYFEFIQHALTTIDDNKSNIKLPSILTAFGFTMK